MRGMANVKTYYDKGKGKAICQSSEVDETTSAVVDVVSNKEMKGGGEDVLDDATIWMYVEQIEAVYSAKALELAVVNGTATENEKTVENKDGEDEEGGAAGGQSGGRANKSNVGVRGEVAPRKAVGGKTADQSRSNGGGSSGKKHGRDKLKEKSSFEEYIDDGREYIVTSRSCLGGIYDDDFVEPNHPEVVLVTPPKESNQHRREVDDDDDFVEPLPRNPSGSSNPCKISHGTPSLRDVVDDDDFLDPVPASVAGSSNSSKLHKVYHISGKLLMTMIL
ncbi:hypothetical protein Bca101_043718 [Brassica carinata]